MSFSLSDYMNQKRRPDGSPGVRISNQPSPAQTVPVEVPVSQKENLKLVVRLLPPDIEEKSFFALVKPWVNDDSTNSTYFVPGHVSKKLSKKPVNSRAYMIMKSQQHLEEFYKAFKNEVVHHFDGETLPLIEIAPFQGKLKPSKPNNLAATIADDPDYQKFVKFIQRADEAKTNAKEAKAAEEAAAASTGRIVAVPGTGPMVGVHTETEIPPAARTSLSKPESSKSAKATDAHDKSRKEKGKKDKESSSEKEKKDRQTTNKSKKDSESSKTKPEKQQKDSSKTKQERPEKESNKSKLEKKSSKSKGEKGEGEGKPSKEPSPKAKTWNVVFGASGSSDSHGKKRPFVKQYKRIKSENRGSWCNKNSPRVDLDWPTVIIAGAALRRTKMDAYIEEFCKEPDVDTSNIGKYPKHPTTFEEGEMATEPTEPKPEIKIKLSSEKPKSRPKKPRNPKSGKDGKEGSPSNVKGGRSEPRHTSESRNNSETRVGSSTTSPPKESGNDEKLPGGSTTKEKTSNGKPRSEIPLNAPKGPASYNGPARNPRPPRPKKPKQGPNPDGNVPVGPQAASGAPAPPQDSTPPSGPSGHPTRKPRQPRRPRKEGGSSEGSAAAGPSA